MIDGDVFDGIVQAPIDEVAPGMLDAIRASLASTFEVGELTVRTVLAGGDGLVAVRWAVECMDTAREDRRITRRALTVHGMSLVGGPDGERVVAHHVDWAGVMAQLGMTTSRPSALDTPDAAPG